MLPARHVSWTNVTIGDAGLTAHFGVQNPHNLTSGHQCVVNLAAETCDIAMLFEYPPSLRHFTFVHNSQPCRTGGVAVRIEDMHALSDFQVFERHRCDSASALGDLGMSAFWWCPPPSFISWHSRGQGRRSRVFETTRPLTLSVLATHPFVPLISARCVCVLNLTYCWRL